MERPFEYNQHSVCAHMESTHTPKVSVLLPLYNTKEEHLRECIESIFAQTFSDFELIIVNDSPDNTQLDTIVASYQDERIRYYRNDKNLGISATRNKMIDLAQGEYLAVMDHDDICMPTRFEKQVAYLDTHPHTGVLGTQAASIPAGKVLQTPEYDIEIKLGLMWGCFIIHPTAMIRAAVLKQAGARYESHYSPAEDHALFCRLIPHTRFHNLPEELLTYRIHKTNTSRTQEDKMKKATEAVRVLAEQTAPGLFKEYTMTARQVTRIKLFGIIPLLKVVNFGYTQTVYLFGSIPLYTTRTSIKP